MLVTVCNSPLYLRYANISQTGERSELLTQSNLMMVTCCTGWCVKATLLLFE